MLARLLLAILLAAFAVPSMVVPSMAVPSVAGGSCHDAPMIGMATAGHAVPGMPAAPDRHAAAHACIGCIPPSDWRTVRIAAPYLPGRLQPLARIARLDAGAVAPPRLPPPRRT